MNPDLLAANPAIDSTLEAAADLLIASRGHVFTSAGQKALKLLYMRDQQAATQIAHSVREIALAPEDRREAVAFAKNHGERLDSTGRQVLASIFLRDPEGARELAAGIVPAPEGAKLVESPHDRKPPRPLYSLPGHPEYERNDEEKAAELGKRIAEIRAEGRFTSYLEAREEARRRAPHLFS